MQHNPYQAPIAAIERPSPIVLSGEPDQPWTAMGTLNEAWALIRERKAAATGFFFVACLPMLPITVGQMLMIRSEPQLATSVPFLAIATVVLAIVQGFMNIGATRACLTLIRGGSPTLGQLFSGFDCIGPIAVIEVTIGLAGILLGVALPGAFLGSVARLLLLLLAPFLLLARPLIVDGKVGLIEAVTASIRRMTPYWGRTVGLTLLAVLLVVASGFTLGILMPVAFVVMTLAMNIVYVRVTGRDQES